MEIKINGTPKEISDLCLFMQARQEENSIEITKCEPVTYMHKTMNKSP